MKGDFELSICRAQGVGSGEGRQPPGGIESSQDVHHSFCKSWLTQRHGTTRIAVMSSRDRPGYTKESRYMEPGDQSSMRALLEIVTTLAPNSYLVGGFVRDHLLGRTTSVDLDIAVGGDDGFKVAHEIAQTLGRAAAFVPLDRQRGTARIVVQGEERVTLDISTLKGADIDTDLILRDFTINAVAVSIEDFLRSGFTKLVDPTGGLADITAGIVRVCSDKTFADDPLRILRAFRFSASLTFEISQETLASIPRNLDALVHVSTERIRDELMAILSAGSSLEALTSMDRWGVIDLLFPEFRPMKGCIQNDYHHLDVWGHTLETLHRMEDFCGTRIETFGHFSGEISEYLSEEPVLGRPRKALLKLAALYHDVGKPASFFVDSNGRVRFFGHEKISRQMFEDRGERLKLATREINMVGEWIGGHMRPMTLINESFSSRALHRLLSRFQREVFGLAILFLSDLAASRGPARSGAEDEKALTGMLQTFERWRELERSPQTPFLNGRDLMTTLGLEEGPYLGSILRRLAELQGSMEITTKEEALIAARNLVLCDRTR